MSHPSSGPHDNTPLLVPQPYQHVSSTHIPHSSISSITSPSGSVSSSSSSLTVLGAAASQARSHRSPTARQAQGHTPPPTYSTLGTPPVWTDGNDQQSGEGDNGSPAAFGGLFGAAPPQVHQFGPTPLRRAATVPYATYIDAPGAPDARAWRRFVGAFGFALFICALFTIGVTLEVVGEKGWLNWKPADGLTQR